MRQSIGARPVVYFGSLLWVFFCSFFYFLFFYSYEGLNVTSALSLTETMEDLDKLSALQTVRET